MKRIEQATVLLAILGLIFKLLLLPGGSFMMALSLTILAVIYYPLGFFFFNDFTWRGIFQSAFYRKVSPLRIFGTIGAGLLYSILAIGVLFKLLQLPGSSVMLMVGTTSIGVLFIVILVRFIRYKSSFLASMLRRTVIWTILGLIILFDDRIIWTIVRQYLNPLKDEIKMKMK